MSENRLDFKKNSKKFVGKKEAKKFGFIRRFDESTKVNDEKAFFFAHPNLAIVILNFAQAADSHDKTANLQPF
jgi:hypothetical protein